MPLSFPANPLAGQEYEFNGRLWRFNGAAWDAVARAIADPTIDDVEGLTAALALLATKADVGDPSQLSTVTKNIVGAINELLAKPGSQAFTGQVSIKAANETGNNPLLVFQDPAGNNDYLFVRDGAGSLRLQSFDPSTNLTGQILSFNKSTKVLTLNNTVMAASTPAQGTRDGSVATTLGVHRSAKSQNAVSITGDTTLTAGQADCGTLMLIGTLTAAAVVTVPSGANRWTIYNATSGGFSVSIKATSSTNVVVVPNQRRRSLWTDGSGVFPQDDPLPAEAAALTSNFAFNSLVAPGAYYGLTSANDAPVPGVATNYAVEVEYLAKSSATDYFFVQTAVDGSGHAWTRRAWYANGTTNTWPWQPIHGTQNRTIVGDTTVLRADDGAHLTIVTSGVVTLPAAVENPGMTVTLYNGFTSVVLVQTPGGIETTTKSVIGLYPGESVRFEALAGRTFWSTAGRAKVVKLGEVGPYANVASVALTVGFDDPEFSRIEVNVEQMYGATATAAAALIFRTSTGDYTLFNAYASARDGSSGTTRFDYSNPATAAIYLTPPIDAVDGTHWATFSIDIPRSPTASGSVFGKGVLVRNRATTAPAAYSFAGSTTLASTSIVGMTLKMAAGNIGGLARITTYGYRT
jgi:hypothetical protein